MTIKKYVYMTAAACLLATSSAHASFATSCQDSQPWYHFSMIEAATCLLSGQW